MKLTMRVPLERTQTKTIVVILVLPRHKLKRLPVVLNDQLTAPLRRLSQNNPRLRGSGMAHWRETLFAVMSRNAGSAADFFRLPNNCVIELGARVQI